MTVTVLGTLVVLSATLSVAITGVERADAATAVVPAIPDTNYPIPTGALFVSPSGSDANPGTLAAPLATLGRAVALAPSGATIVLRSGRYRESINSVYHRLTIQAYPHEQPWLDGRRVVTGFSASGTAWAHTGWNPGLCETCYDPNAILASYPAAGLPDMVFVDGAALAQVTTLSALKPGKFFVDATNHVLYLGSDPSGHVVEATVYSKAIEFNTSGAAGSILRGVGVIGYGSVWNSNANSAMVIAGSQNITFENDVFAYSASRGLAIFASGGVVRGSTFVANGFQGIVANLADGLLIDTSDFEFNNAENFVYKLSPYAGAAGAKITSSKNVTVRDSIFRDNSSSALWFDISNQGVTAVRNLFQRNLWNGLTVELSDTELVASNLSVNNAGFGIKISGTTNARIWNNTIANNGTAQLGVFEDPRTNPNTTQYAAGITWDTAKVTAQNNILASDGPAPTMPLLQTGDSNSPKKVTASQMISALDYSVYARASATAPADQAFWCNLTASAYGTHYKTLATFHSGTGLEPAGIERVTYTTSPLFVSESTGDYHLVAGSPATGTGRALPSDIAATVGVTAGVAVNRGALVWPGSATAATTANPLMPTSVFGVVNPATGDRIYTTSSTEVNTLLAAGYTSLGVVFHAATAPSTGIGAIYRLRGLSNNHLYTPWTTERDNLVAGGWTLEGTAFYAPTVSMAGLIQVYRYYDTVTYDHYLSTSATVPVGSRFDANVFWAAP